MTMAPNPANYVLRQRWTESQVSWLDFWDPDRVAGLDTYYFDKLGTAFSMFSGHGLNPAGAPFPLPCQTSSACNSPPAGATFPSFCRKYPGSTTGDCTYHSYDRAIVPSSEGCRYAGYSNTGAAWGESGFTGTWGGAGTNGGTNAVILDISHAHNSNRTAEVWPAFAGIHMLLTPLNHTGDTGNFGHRGYWFAQFYYDNPYSSVAFSWTQAGATMWGMIGCYNREGTVMYGAGYGING